MRKLGRYILIIEDGSDISHILGELPKIAARDGIIKDGALVEEFSRKELETRCRRCQKLAQG